MDRRVEPGGDESRKSPFGGTIIISVHARASGNPGFSQGSWVPAFAGMNGTEVNQAEYAPSPRRRGEGGEPRQRQAG
jgi:hypothetical protein